MGSGAVTSSARIRLIVCLFDFTELFRTTTKNRNASSTPSSDFGNAVDSFANTDLAGFSASVGSDFLPSLGFARFGRLTS
jgi:hypothetical protein